MSFDFGAMAEAMRGAGNDTRQWISYGTVEAAQKVGVETVEPVEFDTDGMGPLVNVRLQPSNKPVRCRVAASIAGNGEGSYHPFVTGDEVIVAIPGGDERSGCVIFGRLSNTIDKFPTDSIAGQDPTKNTFGFERRRTPFLQEYGSSYMLRVAGCGAFFLISADTGTITLRDGSKGALQMGPDIFGYMEGTRQVGGDSTPTPTALFQLDLTGRRVTLQMDDARLMLNSSSSDQQQGNAFLNVPAELTVSLGTNAPQETVLTLEAFAALLGSALAAVAPGGALGVTKLIADITAGGAPLNPLLGAAIAAGRVLAAAKVKPDTTVSAVPGVQMLPGLGAVLFKTG